MWRNKRSKENPNWRAVIIDDVESEGFDNQVLHYDDYSWVDDVTLQQLRAKYIEARSKLQNYIGVNEDDI